MQYLTQHKYKVLIKIQTHHHADSMFQSYLILLVANGGGGEYYGYL